MRVGFGLSQDAARQGTGCEIRAGHKSHQRTKAPSRRSAQEVEPGDGRLESVIEFGIAVYTLDGIEQRSREKWVAGNVDPVTGGKQGVIHVTYGAIVQGKRQSAAMGNGRGYGASGGNANRFTAWMEPRREPIRITTGRAKTSAVPHGGRLSLTLN